MEESTEVQCPICNMSFRDKRWLTSHARNKHDLKKDEIFENKIPAEKEKEEWKIIGGIGALVIAIVTLGRYN